MRLRLAAGLTAAVLLFPVAGCGAANRRPPAQTEPAQAAVPVSEVSFSGHTEEWFRSEMERQGVVVSEITVERGLGFAGDKALARVSVHIDPANTAKAAQDVVRTTSILTGPEEINGLEIGVFDNEGRYLGAIFTDALTVRSFLVERLLSESEFQRTMLLDVMNVADSMEGNAPEPLLRRLFPDANVLYD